MVISIGIAKEKNLANILNTIGVEHEIFSLSDFANSFKTKSGRQIVKIKLKGGEEFCSGFLEVFQKRNDIIIAEISEEFVSMEKLPLLKKILPFIEILIIGKADAEIISGIKINSFESMTKGGERFLEFGVKSALIKNVGPRESSYCDDFFSGFEKTFRVTTNRVDNAVPDGKSSALATAIAGSLSTGLGIFDSLALARGVTQNFIRLGKGNSTQSTFGIEPCDFPWISDSTQNEIMLFDFPRLESENRELYPIVDSFEWVKRLLPFGVKTIQLRIKNLHGAELENEIEKSILLAKEYDARLFINDFWEIAIKHSAYGVHLGMEDLATADITQIQKAGLRLGLSTHCYFEAAIAHSFRPSYIALGPIYFTKLKAMDFPPQGIEVLKLWRKLFDYPLVAIGGITLEKSEEVLSGNPDFISVVRDITQSDNPEKRVKDWNNAIGKR